MQSNCMRNWGRGALVGRGACWCVTFFSLRGLLLVGAVQSSPCSGKTGQKGRFRVCWESFVPVGPARPMCRESFVPVGPPNWIRQASFVPAPAPRAVQSSPCLVWWWANARNSSPSARKMAQNRRFVACWESFVPVGPPNWIRWESFVPVGPPNWIRQESFVPVGPPNWIRRESFVPGPAMAAAPTARRARPQSW